MSQEDTVTDDEKLYRRIPNNPKLYTVENGITRFSSQAFNDRKMEPSVDRAKLCNNDPTHTQHDSSDGVISLIAGDIRAIGTVEQYDKKGHLEYTHTIDVIPVPIKNQPPLPDNPAHASIIAEPEYRNEKTFRRLKQALARLATRRGWEIEPS